MSTATRDTVRQKVQQLEQIVNTSIENTDALDLAAVQNVLDRAETEIEIIRSQRSSGVFQAETSEEEMNYYFPSINKSSPRRIVTEDELHRADEIEQRAIERGRRHIEDAKTQLGLLLTPGETAKSLGISSSTVKSWRRQNKLLGLRFDKHQYLYPLFQFVESPKQGELRVLSHLDEVLAVLGDRGAWEKAKFFLAPSPFLSGETPLALLNKADHGDDSDRVRKDNLSRVRRLARYTGEMGS